jgi:serine/threonine-protein kinase
MTTLGVGALLAGYRLDAVLGQGGMGCVYRATHTKLGRQVAVKVLADALAAQEEFVSRFLSEAKIVNDVRHPNIVDVSDLIELESPRRVAYVMEFIEGPSLAGVLKKRPLSVRQAMNVGLQLASALEAVHALNVVHRDLKPDNVLVTGDLSSDLSAVPSVKILDFGIAKVPDHGGQHKTITGSILGTPSYMAPEQVAAGPVSAATDVYAIGEIVYEMIAGRRLFRGEQMAILRAKLLGELPPLELPDHLASRTVIEYVVRRSLALEPKDRPSLSELVKLFRDVLEAEPEAWTLITTDTGKPLASRPEPVAAFDPGGHEVTPANLASMVSLTASTSRAPLIAMGISAVILLGIAALSVGLGEPRASSAPMAAPAVELQHPAAASAAPAVEPPPAAAPDLAIAEEPAPPPEAPAAEPSPAPRKKLGPKRPDPSPAPAKTAAPTPPVDTAAKGPLKKSEIPTW